MIERHLIVNADDLGMSPGVNAGILQGHVAGIVTSASLMTLRDFAADAVASTRAHPRLSLGLHVELGEWRYADGEWTLARRVCDPDDAAAVAEAVRDQLERFVALCGREPTHLDSHQHVHQSGPARPIMCELADRLGVPLRGIGSRVAHRGEFHGQDGRGFPYPEGITTAALVAIAEGLPPGVSELGCHPAATADCDPPYQDERVRELDALCAPETRAALDRAGVALISFAELPA